MEISQGFLVVGLVLFGVSVPFLVRAARRGALDRQVIAAAVLMDSAAAALVVAAFLPEGALRLVLFTVPWPLIVVAAWLWWQHHQLGRGQSGG